MNGLTVWENIKARLAEASTIRGLILLLGLIGWKVSPEEWAAYVAVIDAIVYIAYEILRTDSAAKAVNEVTAKLSKANFKIVLLCLVMLGFMLGGVSQAADLYISAEGTVTAFDVSIEDPGAATITYNYQDIVDFDVVGPDAIYGGTQYRIMNVDHLSAGDYRIVVKACNGEWCSVSDPLLTGRPGIQAGSLMIQ